MNSMKFAVLFIFCLMQPVGVLADTKPTTMAKVEITQMSTTTAVIPDKIDATQAPVQAAEKKPEGLIIGKNLKVGMPLEGAIKLLGIPSSMNIKRGTESKLDSIAIDYQNHGIILHVLNGKRQVEALEILPQFQGSFVEGVKMGENFTALIDKYGVPQSMNASLAKYPKKGMYFSLKENIVIAAYIFVKNSKLLSHQLYKNR